MFKLTPLKIASAFAFAISACTTAQAQDSALLDLLVKKKIVSEKEADEVRSDLEKEQAANSANKLKLSTPVKELRISGDGRLRFQGEGGKAIGSDDHGERDRWRYRLRLDADWKMSDNWSFGMRLEAGPTLHSANVTMGENPAFNKAGTIVTSAVTSTTTGKVVTGFDAATGKPITGTAITGVKTSSLVSSVRWEDTVFIGKLYLKYAPFGWLAVEGGRLANPYVQGNVGAAGASSLVWDPDAYPQGFAEQFKLTLGSRPAPAASDAKGVTPPARGGMTLDLFANFGQFVYEDVFENSFNSFSGLQTPSKFDRWMLGWQVGAKLNFDTRTYFQFAPSIYNYTGGGDLVARDFNGDGPQVILNKQAKPTLVTFNQTGVNDLAILDIPAEFDWTMLGVPFVVFGEFADNLDSGARADKAGHPDRNEGIAWAAGLGIGKIKKRGDWEIKAWWQHDEQFSLDPNIIDDDVFNNRLNMEGFVVRAAYSFTDFAWLSAVYARGERIDSALGTGGIGSLGVVPLQTDQLFLLDLNLKF